MEEQLKTSFFLFKEVLMEEQLKNIRAKKKKRVEHIETGIIFHSEYYAAKALKVGGRNLRNQLTGEKRNMLGIRYIE